MSELTPRDRELVALGAALGSNCVPCIEYHIPEARKAGLGDEEIRSAIQHADKIRQVPARKVLQAALGKLAPEAGTGRQEACGAADDEASGGTSGAAQPMAAMFEKMSSMMAERCGQGRATSPSAGKPDPGAAPNQGCACG